MSPLPVVEHLDVFPDLRHRLLPGAILSMVNQLGLECAEETLHRCIVPAVPFPAHGWGHLELRHQLLVAV